MLNLSLSANHHESGRPRQAARATTATKGVPWDTIARPLRRVPRYPTARTLGASSALRRRPPASTPAWSRSDAEDRHSDPVRAERGATRRRRRKERDVGGVGDRRRASFRRRRGPRRPVPQRPGSGRAADRFASSTDLSGDPVRLRAERIARSRIGSGSRVGSRFVRARPRSRAASPPDDSSYGAPSGGEAARRLGERRQGPNAYAAVESTTDHSGTLSAASNVLRRAAEYRDSSRWIVAHGSSSS